MNLFERDRACTMHTYDRLPVRIVGGKGTYLFDDAGRRYLDFFGGLAVNALGYAHPALLEAIHAQVDSYLHISNRFPQDAQVALAEQLLEITNFSRVFFANSGAEAVETALKISRKYGTASARSRIIAFSGAFHGRSMCGLSLTDNENYRLGFAPFLPDCDILPFNDAAALHESVDDTVIAIIFECIQGEGGIIPASTDFISALNEVRDRYELLLIADEIQCGMGRTGRFLACDHVAVSPDIVVVAKALGGGLPLSAVMVKQRLQDVLGPGMHGSTFGGNPVACAAGRVVLDVLMNGLMQHVTSIGTSLRDGLNYLARKHAELVSDIRGMGLMLGMECRRDMSRFTNMCLENALLVNVTRQRVIRLLPPYIITDSDVDRALSILDKTLSAYEVTVLN